jgi:hypothetical protein
MADRDLVHQPANACGGLETGARPYDPPLLPYEVALIEALGCSEQEYRQFVRHAQLQARVRPAEYAHIPDVVNTPLAVAIVSLVLGLASTAVSILLAPKAPALESPAKIKGKKLADQIGPSRFNQTTSFDNVSSLAEYGQPIPIPFGKRGTGSDGALTGGLILAPALVWSRLFSYGNFQRFEGVYVTGEYGIAAPELGGIRLGTTALDNLGDRDFALYWSSSSGNNRPSARIAGTAEATLNHQVFTAPTLDGEYSSGFSMAYNPSGQTQFGTANPIHNGTGYRFNWEVISAPFSTTEGSEYKDERFELRARRRKIAGAKADEIHEKNGEEGQPGVGRQYSRRMGLVAHSGTSNGNAISDRTIVNIAGGDQIVFEISAKNWKEFQGSDFTYDGKKTTVDLKDLKTSAIAWRQRADELLTIGSRWIINASIWVVVARSKAFWEPDGGAQSITLECVATLGTATVGIAGTKTVRTEIAGYDGPDDTPPYVNGGFNPQKHCGAAFHTLCQLYQASIRQVRRDADTIEFGIRSVVWNKALGLCNFNAVPSQDTLYKFDKKDISVTTPKMDKYFARTSCFIVLVRPVNKYGQPNNPWSRIPITFCVTGTSPVEQYNWLRIKPAISGYYEYRFVPVTGTDIASNYAANDVLLQLNGSAQTIIGKTYGNRYGDFRITTSGKEVFQAAIVANEEMYTDPSDAEPIVTEVSGPTSIYISNNQSNTGNATFTIQAWLTQLLGNADAKRGQAVSTSFFMSRFGGTKTLTVTLTATSMETSNSAVYEQVRGSRWRWDNWRFTVTNATGTWNVGDPIQHEIEVGNVFSYYSGYNRVYIQFTVSGLGIISSDVVENPLKNKERVFEEQSQVADSSFYLELTKSNESGPEHEIVYVNECISNDVTPEYTSMSTLGLSVKSNGQINGIGQLRAWSPAGVNVYRLIEGDNAPSNLFADLVYYLLTSRSQGVGNIVPSELIDIESLTIAAHFQRANKMFFDGVVEDSESLRSFLYDNAALQLCNFTIKNGRFGMMPALPYDSNYQISTRPIAVEQIFTAGNIIEDSLQVQYIDAAQRSNFRALVSWRETVENDLPTQASALVDWNDIPERDRATTQQAFDLTDFCTNRAQALKTARFLLSIRRRITHTVSFKTVPDALGIQPGSYIRVITAATSYSAANNGVITDAGTLVSISTIADGTYDAMVYNPATSQVLERKITVSSGSVTDASLYGTLFTLLSETVNKGVYQVEQLTLDEDGLVNVAAVEVPVDSAGASIVAKDVLSEGSFRVLE